MDRDDVKTYFRNLSDSAKEQAFLIALLGDYSDRAVLINCINEFNKTMRF